MGVEFDKLMKMLPAAMAEASRVANELDLIDQAAIEKSKNEAEKDVISSGMLGQVMEDRFEHEATNGIHWAPLAASTIKSRIQKGFGASPMLVNTGKLRGSAIACANTAFSFDNGVHFDASPLPSYAEYVNNGTSKMPWRPFYADPNDEELQPVIEYACERWCKAFLEKVL